MVATPDETRPVAGALKNAKLLRRAALSTAVGLSLTILPLAWVRVTGRFGTRGWAWDSASLTLLLALGLIGVTSGLARRLEAAESRGRRRFFIVLFGLWMLIVAGLAGWEWQFWPPPTRVLPLTCLASLHILWLAWIGALPGRWSFRCGVWVLLLAAALLWLQVYQFAGLGGTGQPTVTWRSRAARAVASQLSPRPSNAPSTQPPRAASSQTAVAGLRQATGPDPAEPADSAQFLGPARTATTSSDASWHAAMQWATQPPVRVWQQAVGAGWGSIAVAEGRAVTQEQQGDEEGVVAFRLSDGQRLWTHRDPLRFDQSLAGPGPRATPAIAQGRIVAVGATGRMNCLDAATGQRIWSVELQQDGAGLPHGSAASPLIWDEWVFACPIAEQGPCLAAYDLTTGQRRWAAGQARASYSSPHPWELDGQRFVLLYHAGRVEAFEFASGKSAWSIAWPNATDTYASQPLVAAGGPRQLLVTAGYDAGAGLFRWEKVAAGYAWRQVWTSRHLKTKFTSAVQVQGTCFGLDNGILCAVDLATGELHWKQGRYGHGQILCAGKYLIIQAEQGFVALVAADPTAFRELARIDALTSKTWNQPALAGPYLLVRNDEQACCFRLAAPVAP